MQKIAPLIVSLLFIASLSGCLGDEDEATNVQYSDDQGNQVISDDGSVYFVDPEGNKIALSATVEDLAPRQLVAGEVNTISVQASGTGVLVKPVFVHFIIEGRIVNDSLVVFEGDLEQQVLVAPNLNDSSDWETADFITYGKRWESFQVDLIESSEPILTGQYWYDLMDHVTDDVNGYNGRYLGQGSPQVERAASFFHDRFESFGLQAEIERYPLQADPDTAVVNVVAYQWGELEDEWIVIGGHFDIAPPPSILGTWQGAYDNTAGTTAIVTLAQTLSQFETNRTIVYGLWSNEEEGLHGARAFVNNLPPGVTVKANINLDMIGLAYPSPGKLLKGMVFPNENNSAIEHPHMRYYGYHSMHDLLDLPRDNETFLMQEGGSSGSAHTPFWQEGIPSVFYHSGPVSNYHTPGDTLANMEGDAGSRELLIAGMHTAAWIVFYKVVLLDDDWHVHPD